MVQCMESWFLADRHTLAQYYGRRFRPNAIPRQADVEQIQKSRVLRALERATNHDTKTRYHKTRHGFELLGRIEPVKVRRASRHADRLATVLERSA